MPYTYILYIDVSILYIMDREDMIKKLMEQNLKLKDQLVEQMDRCRVLEDKHDKSVITASDASHTNEIIDLNKDNTRLKNDVRLLNERIKEMSRTITDNKNQIERLVKTVEDMKIERIKLCNIINEEKSTSIDGMKREMESLRVERDKYVSMYDDSMRMMRQYEERLLLLIDVNGKMKDRLISIDSVRQISDKDGMKEKVDALQSRISDMNSRIKKVIDEYKDKETIYIQQLIDEKNNNSKMKDRLNRCIQDIEFYRKVLRDKNIQT